MKWDRKEIKWVETQSKFSRFLPNALFEERNASEKQIFPSEYQTKSQSIFLRHWRDFLIVVLRLKTVSQFPEV